MVDHVSFEVSRTDAEACAGFYELLGMARVEPPAGLGERSIWLVRDDSSIHLVFRDRDGTDVASSQPAAAGHTALVVPDYDKVIAALRAAGTTIDERSAYWGAARCYVKDPAGNRLELMAAPPVLNQPAAA